MDEREKGGQREHSETSKSSLRPQHVEQHLQEVLRRVDDRLGVDVEHQDQDTHGTAIWKRRRARAASSGDQSRATPLSLCQSRAVVTRAEPVGSRIPNRRRRTTGTWSQRRPAGSSSSGGQSVAVGLEVHQGRADDWWRNTTRKSARTRNHGKQLEEEEDDGVPRKAAVVARALPTILKLLSPQRCPGAQSPPWPRWGPTSSQGGWGRTPNERTPPSAILVGDLEPGVAT